MCSNALKPFAGVYGRWGFVEPNNRNGYQRCAALDSSVEFKFVDERCAKECGFVCDIREYFVSSYSNVEAADFAWSTGWLVN